MLLNLKELNHRYCLDLLCLLHEYQNLVGHNLSRHLIHRLIHY
jgi:hypothetical protein